MFAQQQTQQNFSTFQTSNVSPIGGVLGILPAQAPGPMSFADPMMQPQMDFGMPNDPFQGGFGMNMGFGDMGGFGMGGFGEYPPMHPVAGPGYQNQAVYPDPYQQPQPGFANMPMMQPDINFGMQPQPQGWVDPNTTTFPMANNGWDMNQQGNNWNGGSNFQNPIGGMPPGVPMMPGMDMQYNNGMNPMAGMGGWNPSEEMQGFNGANQMAGKMEVKPKKKK